MQKTTKYSIFETKWGIFGIAGTEDRLQRTHLPTETPHLLISRLLKDLPNPQPEKYYLKPLQQQIIAYFQGLPTDFDIPLELDNFSKFARAVLKSCRNIPLGKTITYSQLAKKANSPNAARAAGSVLAKNPLPLIIPCHRIILKSNKPGQFSAPGGTPLKTKLLNHEQKILSQ